MKLNIFTTLLIFIFITFISCNPKNEKITEIGGFNLPEGACSDGENIYISNV